MKLFTRLINEGVFIFWNSGSEDATFNLKIRILIGDQKIALLDFKPEKGHHYYSFDRVGSGDYEIELNEYKNDRLCQTEVKNIKIISSVQKSSEDMASIMEVLDSIKFNISRIESNVDIIKKDF